MYFETVFEDEYLYVINKQSGVHSTAIPKANNESVAKLLLDKNPALSSVAEKAEDAGLINRLDYQTSGLLIGAKEKEIWKLLKEQIKNEEIYKSYLALLEGKIEQEQLIENYIYTRYKRSKRVSVSISKPEKRALLATSRFLLKHYDAKKDVSFTKIEVNTARRHQIRAHASFIGHPLLGDSLYNAKRKLSDVFKAEELKGLCDFVLHAETVSFFHPKTGERLDFSVPVPYLANQEQA